MSEPSDWPLSKEGLRILMPKLVLNDLEHNALAKDCYPTALGYYPNAYRHQMRRTGHDDYLIMYCIAGQGELSINGQTRVITPGDLMILPPGMAHAYQASIANPWSVFWCHFKGQHSDSFFEHIGFSDGIPLLHGLNEVQLQSSFKSMMDIANSGYSLDAFIHLSNQLRQTLTLIARLFKKAAKREANKSLLDVRNYMRSHLHERLSLEDLAKVANLSKYHFTRKYRELTGYAPLQHFEHLKIEQACLLLEQTGLSISEIAFQLGYDDPLYFSRVFRKVANLSPSSYRARWSH